MSPLALCHVSWALLGDLKTPKVSEDWHYIAYYWHYALYTVRNIQVTVSQQAAHTSLAFWQNHVTTIQCSNTYLDLPGFGTPLGCCVALVKKTLWLNMVWKCNISQRAATTTNNSVKPCRTLQKTQALQVTRVVRGSHNLLWPTELTYITRSFPNMQSMRGVIWIIQACCNRNESNARE